MPGSRMRSGVFAALGLCLALAGSCNNADHAATCGPDSCAGCCLDGVCVDPTVPEACGVDGAACIACEAGQSCTGGACAAAPVCGNSTLEAGEQCDDGNLSDGDGCSSTCTIESAADADAGSDAAGDTGADVPTCSDYPAGPYAFQNVGDTLAPMRWNSARSGIDEELAADLSAIRCAPGVKSIFLMVVTETCPHCPTRMAEINAHKADWQAWGTKWIFLVTDAGAPQLASRFIDSHGITFGWRSNDLDNSLGQYAIAQATAYVPWIAAVRASDMTIRYMETPTAALDIEACAQAIAAE